MFKEILIFFHLDFVHTDSDNDTQWLFGRSKTNSKTKSDSNYKHKDNDDCC